MLNGRPITLRLVLDQGYWPETRADGARRRRAAARRRAGQGRWASTACASTRRSRTRATCTGPTRSGCWCGRRCRAPIASRAQSVERLTREWTAAIAARPQPPVHHRVGAVQRVAGACPTCRTARRSGTTSQALYHLTKTLDPTRPVSRQRRLGERRRPTSIGIHDYDDDPDAHRGTLRRPAKHADELFRRERPGGRMLVARTAHPHAGQPLVLTEFGGIAFSDNPRQRGAIRAARLPRSSPSGTHVCWNGQAACRFSPASATPSSPTPIRRRTDCCMLTARQSSRSSRSRWRRVAYQDDATSAILSITPNQVPKRADHSSPRSPHCCCSAANGATMNRWDCLMLSSGCPLCRACHG